MAEAHNPLQPPIAAPEGIQAGQIITDISQLQPGMLLAIRQHASVESCHTNTWIVDRVGAKFRYLSRNSMTVTGIDEDPDSFIVEAIGSEFQRSMHRRVLQLLPNIPKRERFWPEGCPSPHLLVARFVIEPVFEENFHGAKATEGNSLYIGHSMA